MATYDFVTNIIKAETTLLECYGDIGELDNVIETHTSIINNSTYVLSVINSRFDLLNPLGLLSNVDYMEMIHSLTIIKSSMYRTLNNAKQNAITDIIDGTFYHIHIIDKTINIILDAKTENDLAEFDKMLVWI